MDYVGKKVLLIIPDGIGYMPGAPGNAFEAANTPTFDDLFKTVPWSLVGTYGRYVGLPDGQMGNSEVGHMTIGTGRVVLQDLLRINEAFQTGEIRHNDVLADLLYETDKIHIIGLLSDGGVHSHYSHIIGLADFCARMGKKVFIHAITDGRDTPPDSSHFYIEEFNRFLEEKDIKYGNRNRIKFASIGGRYYVMDRDMNWWRVLAGYGVIVTGRPRTAKEELEYIGSQYGEGITDEFIEPRALNRYEGMENGDGVIMANFRSDRARQLAMLLGDPGFFPSDKKTGESIVVEKRKVHLVTMTDYFDDNRFPVLFQKNIHDDTLGQLLSEAGLRQVRIAESEKNAHVTYFFNGGKNNSFPLEDRVIVPSPDVPTYDQKPEMSSYEVTAKAIEAMRDSYHLVVVNLAQGDMVGHTGIFEAGVKAVEAADMNIGSMRSAARRYGYGIVICADHGNVENMLDENGNRLTEHTVGPVACFVEAEGVREVVNEGGLANVAPTILKMIGINPPPEWEKPLF